MSTCESIIQNVKSLEAEKLQLQKELQFSLNKVVIVAQIKQITDQISKIKRENPRCFVPSEISSDQHAILYAKLRAAILSKHFARGKFFRTNLLSDGGVILDTNMKVEELLKQPPDVQQKTRWNIRERIRENPLMFGGQLLTCLAIEYVLGQPYAVRMILSALTSLSSLYKFQGNHFDGYIIRWDPVASDNWRISEDNTSRYCNNFLIDNNDNSRYVYCDSSADPRYAPFRSERRDKMSQWERDAHWQFFDNFRRWEPSMDELTGLIMGYYMIHHLVSDSNIRV